jgi:membrane protein
MSNEPDEGPSRGAQAESSRRLAHARRAAQSRGTRVAERGRLWIVNRDPASHSGAVIGWVRRYQAADGQLYAVLLSAYLFLTLLPAMLVEASYLYSDPAALADRTERRLGLTGATATLFHSVLVGGREHQFGVVVLALLNLVLFGLGFPRVLQLAHARSWMVDLPKNALLDQARYLAVLLAILLMSFLFVLQTRALLGEPAWIGWLLTVGWLALLIGFFVWAPHLLLHRRIPASRLLPGAIFTVVGLIALRLASSLLLTRWLTSYSTSYGALGIVMAIFFWIIIAGTILVLAAALSPALADRRDLRRARAAATNAQ